MIVDFHELQDGAVLEADVCIIGAGAAGIALSREFIGTPHSVLLLEGGGPGSEPESQSLYDSEIAGYPHNGIHTGRARVFGGTTTLWAGQALPLDAFDFQRRDWVPDSGWPIDCQTVEPYYRRAEEVMGLQPLDYAPSKWPQARLNQFAFDRSQFRILVSQFAPQPNFSIAYGDLLKRAPNVSVCLHANVLELCLDSRGERVESAAFASLTGLRARAKAKCFVICCGGIETARLLLVSDRQQQNGIGNQFDVVGRYFQDHIQVTAVPIRNAWRHIRMLHDPRYVGGVAQHAKLALAESAQEREGLLNTVVGVTYSEFVSDESPVSAGKRVVKAILHGRPGEIRMADVGRAISAPHEIAGAAYRRYVQNLPAFRMEGEPHIGMMCECAPIASSRVTLARSTDRLGVRRTLLDWRISPLVTKTVCKVVRMYAAELKRLGLGESELDGIETRTPEQWKFFDANHHIGAARMSSNPREGVVDSDCRVHGVENLYVGSSAVFPTGGHSNPTLTLLALVMRMADHLKGRLARQT